MKICLGSYINGQGPFLLQNKLYVEEYFKDVLSMCKI